MIFYFSGTGNSKQIAKDLAHTIGSEDIANLAAYPTEQPITAKRIGFVFPTYFWGIPNIIEAFISQLTIVGTPYIYAVATCGEVPGASLLQVSHLLQAKGLKLDAGFYIVMPENYILAFNVPSTKTQDKLFNKAKQRIDAIAQYVKANKAHSLPVGRFIVDGLLGYTVNASARKAFPTKDKGFIVNDKCIGCGKCEKVCPVHNITLSNNKPSWQHHCEFCLACIHHCPTKAIDWKNKTQKRGRYLNPHL